MGDTIVQQFDTTVNLASGYGTYPGAGLFVTCADGASDTYITHGPSGPSSSAYADLSIGFSDILGGRNVASATGFASVAIGSNADQLDNGQATLRYTDVAGLAGFFGFSPGGTDKYLPDCWDTDGFWTTDSSSPASDAAGIIMGNQIQVKSAQMDLNTSTGNQSVTGVGFEPDIVMFFGCIQGRTDTGSAWNAPGSNIAFGVMDSAGNQWASCARSAFQSGPTSIGGLLNQVTRQRRFRNDACILHIGQVAFANPTTFDQIASFVSMNTDGFTINLTAAGADDSGDGMILYYLAMKAESGNAQFKCGVGTQGDSSLTAGFQPDAILFGSAITPNNNIDSLYGSNAYGITDGTQQYSGWVAGVEGNLGGPNGDWWGQSYFSTASCIRWAKLATAAPTTPVLVAEATAAMTATGANLTWSTDDSSGNLFGWIAIQTSASTVNLLPTVVTGPATTAGSAATLTGMITPNRVGSVYYQFEWGTSTTYTNVTTLTLDGSGFGPTALSASISGLSVGTTYHYNLCAFKDATRTCAVCDGDQTFVAAHTLVFRNRFRTETANAGATGATGTTAPLVFSNEFKVGQ